MQYGYSGNFYCIRKDGNSERLIADMKQGHAQKIPDSSKSLSLNVVVTGRRVIR